MAKKLCPACKENYLDPVEVRNALSRYCKKYICSECGTREAFEGFFWDKKGITKLKNHCNKVLVKLSSLSQDTTLADEKGNLDIKKLNEHPIVISAKDDIKRKSVELFGKNIVTRKWLTDNGFFVAGMILVF